MIKKPSLLEGFLCLIVFKILSIIRTIIKIKMDKEEIKLALDQIEQDCMEREVGDGVVETYINTNKFYNRVKGLMSILNQNKDDR